MTTSILGEIHVKTNRFRPRIPAVRPCDIPQVRLHARNARLCRFACKELTQHLKVNTIIAEFLFHKSVVCLAAKLQKFPRIYFNKLY